MMMMMIVVRTTATTASTSSSRRDVFCGIPATIPMMTIIRCYSCGCCYLSDDTGIHLQLIDTCSTGTSSSGARTIRTVVVPPANEK